MSQPIEDEGQSIVLALCRDDFEITEHAYRRMSQRSVIRDDIITCGQTSTSCAWNMEHETYEIKGMDCDGEELTVSAILDGGAVIVTVF